VCCVCRDAGEGGGREGGGGLRSAVECTRLRVGRAGACAKKSATREAAAVSAAPIGSRLARLEIELGLLRRPEPDGLFGEDTLVLRQ
jgi:hypothetical protein